MGSGEVERKVWRGGRVMASANEESCTEEKLIPN